VLIDYRQSPLSSGRAGRVHGGDRLPWVGDNYKPLESLDWQVHFYGPPKPGFKHAGYPVHQFPWTDAAREAGLQQNVAYEIRPDGYIAAIVAPS
jgi:hypothetical protein